jgi:hypothetical protein
VVRALLVSQLLLQERAAAHLFLPAVAVLSPQAATALECFEVRALLALVSW